MPAFQRSHIPSSDRSARFPHSVGWLAALAAALIGSGWQIGSRHGVTTHLGPMELAFMRYAIPALFLAPLWLCRSTWRAWKRAGPHCLALVVCGGLPFGLLVLAGAQWAPAAHMGIFLAGTLPLLTALSGWAVSGRRPSRSRWMGLVLIGAGIAVFGVRGWQGGHGAWRGDLLFIAAAMMWAAYTLVFRASGLTAWQGAAAVSLGSALMLVPLLWVVGAPRLLTAPWGDLVLQAMGQGVVAGLLGVVVYGIAVSRLGAPRASLSAALVPLFTALGAAWLLDEALSRWLVLAIGLVVLGIPLGAGVLEREEGDGK